MGFLSVIIGSALALGAASYDYLTGGPKAIGDSQLGAFFLAMAVALFGATMLKFMANETLKHRILGFEKVHKDVKADPVKGIKGVFGPVGLIGALAGIGVMVGLTLKDYSPPMSFGIGSFQTLGIFAGSVLAIAGISFMSVGNTFMTISMRVMVQQFGELTKERPKKLVRVNKVNEGVSEVTLITAKGPVAVGAELPVIEPGTSMEPPTIPAPEPIKDTGTDAVPLYTPPAPAVEAIEPAPIKEEVPSTTVEVAVEPKPADERSWSEPNTEELALAAMKEAAAELGIDAMAKAITESPAAVESSEAAGATPEPTPEVEVFECPNCQAAVREEDKKCPSCGVSFEEEEKEETEKVEAETDTALAAELEVEPGAPGVEAAPPAPEPPAPATLPPVLPPSLPPASKKEPKSPIMDEEIAPPLAPIGESTPSPVPASTKVEEASVEDETTTGKTGILQSILNEISKKGPKPTKVEEQAPVEEDVTSEVPSTCPNCGRKMKASWRSCPYCGLEFR